MRLGTTMATDELLAEIRDLIAEREELGVRGLAERLGPSEWADLVPRLEPDQVAVLSLHNLVLTRPSSLVGSVMLRDPVRVRADADQETAARLLTDHNLLALPVVDADDHLLGIITQDDVADVLEEEATEDFERIGGSQPLDVPYRFATAGLLVRRRIGL